MKILRVFLTLLILAAIAGGTYFVTRDGASLAPAFGARDRKGGNAPVAIVAEKTRLANFPVYLDGVGSAKARNSVVVRSQVDGRLIEIKFKEGQDVKKGDLLAKIDATTFQAQLDQARAKKALDEAQLGNSKRDLERYLKVGTLAVTEKQIDTQRTLVIQQEAQVKSDIAAIDNLTAILGYTNIAAPIAGRVGIRNVDEGNLVRAGDPAGIVTITEVRPISVMFTLPQQQLPVLSKAIANSALKVEAYTTDSRTLLDTGLLQVVDNQVDQQTGTIRIKADFPNEKLQLWPGQFVNVRLLVDTIDDAVVAPTVSVQNGPNGPFVYVVGNDDTVATRSVKVSQQTEHDAVILDGLKAGESVVTSGFGRLEDGSKVKVAGARPPGTDKAADAAPSRSAGSENVTPASAHSEANAEQPAITEAGPAGSAEPITRSLPAASPKKAERGNDKSDGPVNSGSAP